MTPGTPYDVHALRAAEFPWAQRGEATYLDHAFTAALPWRAVLAMGEVVGRCAAPFRLRPELRVATLARSRELVARLLRRRTARSDRERRAPTRARCG